MTDTFFFGSDSRVAILGHPLHPMLIPFPIAALAGVLLVDLVYLGTGDAFWARMSMWLLSAGVIMGSLAGLVGYMDFSKIPRARQQRVGWAHAVGNSMVIVLALIYWALRLNAPIGGLVPWGVALSTFCVIGLVFTGWFGGELVYRYHIGMAAGAANEDSRSPRSW